MTTYLWTKSYPENIDWNHKIDSKPLYSILDETAEKFPWNTAIDFFGKKYSYSFLQKEVNRGAEGFKKLGIGKGSRVGIFLPNCPQFIISYFAILKAGATVVNFSPLYSGRELKNQIEDSGTEIMVTLNLDVLYGKLKSLIGTTKLRRIIFSTMPEALPFPKNILFSVFKKNEVTTIPEDSHHIAWKKFIDNEQIAELPEINPEEDVAVIQYTGGTTGTPKGAMLSHYNVYANAIQSALWFSDIEQGKEKMLAVLPFFHVFAMTAVMNFSIVTGAEIILHPRFEIETVLKDIARKKPTLLPGVPTMYTAINNHPDLSKYKLSSLKACISGGAPLPVEVKQKFEELTGCKMIEGYGLTESSPVACANPLEGKNKTGSVGLPLPKTIIEIEDMENRGRFLGAGEKGEICITGPQVMKGYWNRPEETAVSTDEEGRLRTGDIGYMDEDGYIFIVDRLKELIICGGFNVYPRHVEEAIYQHEAVLEAAVKGVPDEYRGQSVKAYVALKKGYELSEIRLIAFLGEHLGKHELPSHIEFRDSLPKTMIGKIDKKNL